MTERLDSHDAIVQKILRDKVLNSVGEAEKRRFMSISTFTEVFMEMKKDATSRDACKADAAIDELYSINQGGHDLVAFVISTGFICANQQC
jgi:hypothetical protein